MMDDETREQKKQLRKARDLSKLEKGEIDEAVKALLQHRHGRRYLWWLLEISQINVNPFTGNALTTSFECGQMNVGQRIQAHIIEVAPEGYLNMLKERKEEHDGNRPDTTDTST